MTYRDDELWRIETTELQSQITKLEEKISSLHKKEYLYSKVNNFLNEHWVGIVGITFTGSGSALGQMGLYWFCVPSLIIGATSLLCYMMAKIP